jgi:hypothetical protein
VTLFEDDGPAAEEVDRYGRYMIDVDGKGKRAYTRATTVSKTLEDTFHLEAWRSRCLAKGVAQRPDLTARAATTPISDKKNWKEIFDQAEVIAAGGAKANLGTAFHALHEQVATMSPEEYTAVPEYLRNSYGAYRSELHRLGIVEILTEVTVAHSSLGIAGKADGFGRLADGRVVVIDRKSGSGAVNYPHGVCIQLAEYANADRILIDGVWVSMAEALPDLDRTVGLVLHIDIESATTHVYDADLAAGWWAALEAVKVRRWRKRKDLLTPYQPEQAPTKWQLDPATPPAVIEQATGMVAGMLDEPPAPTDEQAGRRWGLTAQQIADGEHKTLAEKIQTRAADILAVVSPVEPHPHDAHNLTEESDPERGAKTLPKYAQDNDVARLLADKRYKTKAQLQTAARKLDPAMPVNRTRANLAADMVSHPEWAARWPEFFDTADVEDLAAELPELHSSTEDTSWKPSEAQVAQAIAMRDAEQATKTASALNEQHDAVAATQDYPNAGLPAQDANPYAVTEDPAHAPISDEDRYLMAISQTGNKQGLAAIWSSAQQEGVDWSARLQQAAAVKMASFSTT